MKIVVVKNGLVIGYIQDINYRKRSFTMTRDSKYALVCGDIICYNTIVNKIYHFQQSVKNGYYYSYI